MIMIETYPLTWPVGYRRSDQRISSPFKQSMEKAQKFLRKEIDRLGAGKLVVSSNIPIRKDGMFYADWMSKKIDDPGVAIYFQYKGKAVSMCCDQYLTVWENVYALGKAIEALRGLERWGVSDFLERAFTGFTALPASVTSQPTIWEILGLPGKPDGMEDIVRAYRNKAREVHPDKPGGSKEKFQALQEAYEEALNLFV
jgi:hypothetical protein